MAITQPETANTSRTDIHDQLTEDPTREPHEKESVFHLLGDGSHLEITLFKKSIYKKLLEKPCFQLKWFNILDSDGRERTVDSYEEVTEHPELRVIGVTGRIPVGALSIGVPRNSNSHEGVIE